MHGWNGRILQVNLSEKKATIEEYGTSYASNFLGGRGFAAKIL